MGTRPGPVREEMVGADYLLSIFDYEGFVVRSMPISEGCGSAHVAREWVSLTGAHRRLHNAPYRVLIHRDGQVSQASSALRTVICRTRGGVLPLLFFEETSDGQTASPAAFHL